jgi:hypothetical protein
MNIDKPHALPVDPKDRQYVFTTRDPRDALVSVYFFHLHHHDGSLEQTRENLPILEYAKQYFMVGGRYMGKLDCGWPEYHERWLDLEAANREIMTTSYEALMSNTKVMLSKILDGLGRPVSGSHVEAVIRGLSRQTRPSYVNSTARVPVGMSEWRDCLSGEALSFLRKHCHRTARKLGYIL